MSQSFNKLNQKRDDKYYKDPDDEAFLDQFNDSLLELEQQLYGSSQIEDPFIFSFGPPRSGTTLLSQVIAHGLDVGYINNFMARFWKAPICGIRLSKILFDSNSISNFQSEYGSTGPMRDLHEFGYFWRSWLNKHSFESIKNAKELESQIEWSELKTVLAGIQQQFNKPVLFKNILGSYHLPKFSEVLGKVLYVYIERDPLDTAVSILDARNKYYDDPSTWWSYVPPEYEKIIDQDYWTQIAGQIYYLKKFYSSEFDKLPSNQLIRTTYRELCSNPEQVLEQIRTKLEQNYGNKLRKKSNIPESFVFRTYEDREEEKSKFKSAFKEIEKHD
jgi:LPS sulfotransferase NodH